MNLIVYSCWYIKMIITLYKNCILSNSYNEVIDNRIGYTKDGINRTTLEHYLNGLEKFTTVQNVVYQTLSGTFVFELVNANEWASIFEFNYMKCQQDNFIRYCFIDNITIGNGVAYVEYSEDIWSSYSRTLNIRRGYLTNARNLNYYDYQIPIAELPKDYETNVPLSISPLFGNITRYYLFAQGQRYNLSANGQSSNRQTFVCAFGRSNNNGDPEDQTPFYHLSYAEALKVMVAVRNAQDNEFDKNYYEFDNFTLIPVNYFTISMRDGLVNGVDFIAQTGIPNEEYHCFLFQSETLLGNSIDYEFLSETKTINNDYKNAGIGTLKTEFGIVNNGKIHEVYLVLYVINIDIKLILNYDGNQIDITQDFIIDVPFSSLNGEAMSQRKIANDTQLKNGIQTVANGVIKVFTGAGNEETRSVGSATKYRYGKNGRLTSRVSTPSKISVNEPNTSQIISGANQIIDGAWDIHVALTPKYQSTYGNFILGNNAIIAKYGILLKKIIPVNDIEVASIINNFGYEVYEVVDTKILNPLRTTENYYNVLKFQMIDLYGNFPQEVNQYLKLILTRGIKIWYYGVDNV